MDKITFMKRPLGNLISIPIGIFFCFFGFKMIIAVPYYSGGIVGLLFSIIGGLSGIIGGLIIGCGKQMIEVNFEKQFINHYIRFLFIKINTNKETLPQIAYLLVRDMLTGMDFSANRDLSYYYEISFVTINERKILLVLTEDEKRIYKVVEQLKQHNGLIIKDNTREKILKNS